MWGGPRQGVWPVTRALSAMNHDLVARELPRGPADVWSALSLTTRRHKLIWEPLTGRRLAYDLVHDPSEQVDIAGAHPPDLEPHWQHLEQQWARAAVQAMADDDLAGLRRRLHDLGYL